MADAFGRMVLEYWRGAYDGSGRYRSHSGETRDGHPEWYFGRSFDRETEAALDRVSRVGGTVHDAGCGAGTHALAMQADGVDVVATDVSPGAVRVARDRGVAHVGLGDLRRPPVTPDCVFLAGTQLGLGGTVDHLRTTLQELAAVLPADGRIVGDLKDPVDVESSHTAGREELVTFDRSAGIARRRFRTEYRDQVGPWRSLLCLTPAAARRAVAATPWTVTDVLRGDGARYFLVLERDHPGDRPQN